MFVTYIVELCVLEQFKIRNGKECDKWCPPGGIQGEDPRGDEESRVSWGQLVPVLTDNLSL